ncbi:MAG: alanine racemase, partial [Pseudobdellovibrionaceae bacterium]
MIRNTYAEIDLGALADNFNSLRHLFGNSNFICPMVKANAYGHGDIEIAKALEQNKAKFLGVCLIEEGIRLRSAGVGCKILNFGVFG